MKVTLDTNVLVSGTFWSGNSFRILNSIDKNEVKNIIGKILLFAKQIKPKQKIDVIKDDPDDNKIIACAIESSSEYVITYDKHLLKLKEYKGIKIITPEEFNKICY